MKARFLSVWLSLAALSAQAGVIRGVITDAKTGTPLTGVGVTVVDGGGRGAATDLDGNFLIVGVPAGKGTVALSYIGYTKETAAYTLDAETDTVKLTLTMKAEGSQSLKGVTVRAVRAQATEASVMMEIKKSNLVVSGVSAAQISKTMDRNAADVVKRIPGVTVIEDRFIMVRGLMDRYNNTWLNEAGAPSAEIDKRSFSFDLIPTGLIDKILVFKTPSAELPGDFGGGMVKVYTTSMPDKNSFQMSLSGSYRDGSTSTNFNYNPRSSTDWLGYDDGRRQLPAGFPTAMEQVNKDVSWAGQFNNNWVVNSKKLGPDFRGNLALTRVFRLGSVRIANVTGLSYSSVSTNYSIRRRDYDLTDTLYDFTDLQSVTRTSVSGINNTGIAWGNNRIEFKNLYNQTGRAFTTVRNSNFYPGDQSSIYRGYNMGYESIATYAGQLNGSHSDKADTRRYTWGLGYTSLFRDQPDLMRIQYRTDTSKPNDFRAYGISNQVDAIYGGGKWYSQLFENVYSFGQQYTQKVNVRPNFQVELNAGSYLEYKTRGFFGRNLGFTTSAFKGTGSAAIRNQLTSLPVSEIFAPENVGGPNKFTIQDRTNDFDSYKAQNRLIAGFVSANLPVGKRVKALVGLRYEDNLQSIQTSVNLNPLDTFARTRFLLPSANITYNFNTKSLVRLAYGKTLNRPEFREWAPLYFFDLDNRQGVYGSLFPTIYNQNPQNANLGRILDVAEIQNFDARWEFYPAPGEMIHAGIYYKHFTNPIQFAIIPGGDQRDFTFINAESAYTAGVELDYRKNLGFLASKLNAGVFRDLTLVANASFTTSRLNFPRRLDTALLVNAATDSGQRLSPTRLAGQSPYVFNIGAYYQNDKWGTRGSLLYNVFGPRIYAVGINTDSRSIVPNLIEMPVASLDLSLEKTVWKYFSVFGGVQNLLDSKVQLMYDLNRDNKYDTKDGDQEFRSYRTGRYFTVGLRFRMQ